MPIKRICVFNVSKSIFYVLSVALCEMVPIKHPVKFVTEIYHEVMYLMSHRKSKILLFLSVMRYVACQIDIMFKSLFFSIDFAIVLPNGTL
jgi:hypothetical protein